MVSAVTIVGLLYIASGQDSLKKSFEKSFEKIDKNFDKIDKNLEKIDASIVELNKSVVKYDTYFIFLSFLATTLTTGLIGTLIMLATSNPVLKR